MRTIRIIVRNPVAVMLMVLSTFVHAFSSMIPELAFLVSLKYYISICCRVTFYAMLRDIEANAGTLEFDALKFIFAHMLVMTRTVLFKKKVTSKTEIKVQTMMNLYAEELKYIRDGIYAFPEELRFSISRTFEMMYLVAECFNEFYVMDLRRRGQGIVKADAKNKKDAESPLSSKLVEYPEYYLQNFHHQSDGWLSLESARRWEFQVEVRFIGSAGTMRRRALPHIKKIMDERCEKKTKLLDIAAGTGQFLHFVRENYPKLQCTAVDLSAQYLHVLKNVHSPIHRSGCLDLVHANAECMPFDDESFDLVTNVYMFHEIPEQARLNVAKEISRVLKPGGKFVFVDSAQLDDACDRGRLFNEALNKSLCEFSVNHHEPYHKHYIGQSMIELFHSHTPMKHVETTLAFLTKIMVFDKP